MDPLVILYVALGVSLVIFVHELGHFAVAKWAGVKVERFSIGFPMPKTGWAAIPFGAAVGAFFAFKVGARPPEWIPFAWWVVGGGLCGLVIMLLGRVGSLKLFTDRDGTEYVLGFVPIGGYVKMLGENPEEQQDEQTKVDPRSYVAQPVYKRMLIISAGVVMNVIFAFIWFAIAYNMGVSYQPTIIRNTVPGSPAWKADLGPGDEIVQINNRRDPSFDDLTRIVALSNPHGPGIHLKGVKASGEPFDITLVPERGDILPVIGVYPQSSTRLSEEEPTVEGMAGARAKPPFKGGDRVVAIDAGAIENFAQLESALDRRRGETVTVRVEREEPAPADGEPKQIDIQLGPNHFRTLGIRTQIGEIVAIKNDSPVAGQIEVGDIITHVNGREVGAEIDPLRLPDELFELAGKETRLTVKRRNQAEPIVVTTRPQPRRGWTERPFAAGDPLTAPALGIAYQVIPVVLAVEPDSPAAKAGVRPKDRIEAFELVPEDEGKRGIDRPLPLTGEEEQNWPFVFWLIQQYPTTTVKLTLSGSENGDERAIVLVPKEDLSWPLPMRGISFQPLNSVRRTKSLIAAAGLGLNKTWDSLAQVYLTLRGIVTGSISPKGLGGPITIVAAAGSSAKKGLADLLEFLALFSANLAVLNFLPIPILDGGHMVFLIWEAVRGKPADERAMIIANYVGLAMIVGLMLYVFVLDVNRWFIQ